MVAHEGHDMSSMSPMTHVEGSHGSYTSMPAMPMAFFTSADTPLYSKAWTPTSASAYAGTCIFLIILAILLRALFTAKNLLETRALESALERRPAGAADQFVVEKTADANSVTDVFTTNAPPFEHFQPFRLGVDLPRAMIVTIIAAVGYLLMLAVMTYNVGYFLAVLAGTCIGELALGRFNQGTMAM